MQERVQDAGARGYAEPTAGAAATTATQLGGAWSAGTPSGQSCPPACPGTPHPRPGPPTSRQPRQSPQSHLAEQRVQEAAVRPCARHGPARLRLAPTALTGLGGIVSLARPTICSPSPPSSHHQGNPQGACPGSSSDPLAMGTPAWDSGPSLGRMRPQQAAWAWPGMGGLMGSMGSCDLRGRLVPWCCVV